jgi:hypothetical protein
LPAANVTFAHTLRIHFLHPPDMLSAAVRRLAEAWQNYHLPAEPAKSPPVLTV